MGEWKTTMKINREEVDDEEREREGKEARTKQFSSLYVFLSS